jgi:hypothetical protein
MTARTGYALLRPTARAMRWGPLAAAAGLGLAIVAVPAILSVRPAAAHLAMLLRLAAACGALGTAFLLDDPATRTTPTVPTSRLVRHLVRAGIALPVIAAWWVAALAVARTGVEPEVSAGLPGAAITLEAAALVVVALALAAAGLRLTADGAVGPLAAPALLLFLAIVWFLPHRVALILNPTDPQWTSAHRRWAVLLVAAAIGFIWASREPSPRRERQRTG